MLSATLQSSSLDQPARPSTAVPLSQRAAALDQLANLWRAGDLPEVDADANPSTGFAALDAELPGHGWPAGQLVELLLDAPGIGELGLLLPALAEVARQRRSSVWVLPSDSADARVDAPSQPYAPALAAAGIDLARSLFVRPAVPRESFWALEQALRAPHLGAVVGWLATGTPDGDFRALRRLQLIAGRHRALVFVLRDRSCALAPSPAVLRLQLEAAADGQLHATILKRRGRPLSHPVALQIQPRHGQPELAELPPLLDAADASITPALSTLAPSLSPALPARRWSLASIFSH